MKLKWPAFLGAAAALAFVVRATLPGPGEGNRAPDRTRGPTSAARSSRPQEQGRGESRQTEGTLPESGLSPEEAVKLLERAASEMKDISERANFAAQVVERLCNNGHSKEAWDLVDDAYGDVRVKQIEAILGCTKVPLADRIRMLGELTDRGDLRAGTKGLVGSLNREQLLELELSDMAGGNAELGGHLAASYTNEVTARLKEMYESQIAGGQDHSAAFLQKTLKMGEAGKLSFLQVGAILASDGYQDEFAHWDMFQKLSGASGDKTVPDVKRPMVEKMIQIDAPRAMDVFIEAGKVRPDTSGIAYGIGFWYAKDSRGANDWMASRLGDLTEVMRNRVLHTVVDISVRDRNLEAARGWADQIRDPEQRNKILPNIR